MPVTHRQRLLAMTAAAALAAAPAAQALAQGSAGTSRMPQTTQTTPQEGGATVVPALTRELVAEDVDVREIRTVERSLEEVFFEMTGGTR